MWPKRQLWRWSMKVALASAIAHAGRLPIVRALARGRRRPLILGYHRVVEDFATSARTEMPNMLISTSMFERHLEWLGRRFRFVSLDEIGARVAEGAPFDEPVAAITFDDGYRDVYDHAYPTLKRKGIPAAVFVVTDLVGRNHWQTHDKLYYLLAKAFARWTDPARELQALLSDLHIPAADVFPTRATTRSPLSAIAALLPSLSQSDVHRVMLYLEAAVGNGATNIPRAGTGRGRTRSAKRYWCTRRTFVAARASRPRQRRSWGSWETSKAGCKTPCARRFICRCSSDSNRASPSSLEPRPGTARPRAFDRS